MLRRREHTKRKEYKQRAVTVTMEEHSQDIRKDIEKVVSFLNIVIIMANKIFNVKGSLNSSLNWASLQ